MPVFARHLFTGKNPYSEKIEKTGFFHYKHCEKNFSLFYAYDKKSACQSVRHIDYLSMKTEQKTDNYYIQSEAIEILKTKKTGNRSDGNQFVYFENDSVNEFVQSLHTDSEGTTHLPNDFIYETFAECLELLSEIDNQYNDRTADFFRDTIESIFITNYELKQWFSENPLAESWLEYVLIAESFTENDSLIEKLYRAYQYYFSDILERTYNFLWGY